MPIPSSATLSRRRSLPALRASRSMRTRTSPASVNFTALPSRLVNTWRRTARRRDGRHEPVGPATGVAFSRARGSRRTSSSSSARKSPPLPASAASSSRAKWRTSLRIASSPSRCRQCPQALAVTLAERCLAQQLGHAQDAVQRGTDLMAHGREKTALGAVGGFRLVLRPAQAGGAPLDLPTQRRGRRRAGGDRCARPGACPPGRWRRRRSRRVRGPPCPVAAARSPRRYAQRTSDMRHRWRVTRLWNSQLRPPPGCKGNCPSTRGWPGCRRPAGDRPPPGRWRSPARPDADARPRRLVAQGKA